MMIHAHPLQSMNMPLKERDIIILTDNLLEDIHRLGSVAEGVELYESSMMQECLRQLRHAQDPILLAHQHMDKTNHLQSREQWAKRWALALSREEEWAWALNRCRKASLSLLYKICDLCWGTSSFRPGLLEVFKLRRINQIMMYCLIMDRANALYNMINLSTGTRGLGWYSRGDEQRFQALCTPPPSLNPECPTINKRLRRLQKCVYSDKDTSHWVHRWLTIQAPCTFACGEEAGTYKECEERAKESRN